MDIYSRYAPFVQDFIYRHSWRSLREVQWAAGEVIFNSDDNLLLSASTASGKTEAAFFPIITLFSEDPPSSVGAVYIGPLKALINDQFMRLNDLCAEGNIPVWHRHGDVSQSHKDKMMKHPSGILQITPESLEALLIHKHSDIIRLFGDLRFIVIDEVHSLLRGDRGGQVLCLIERLSKLAGVIPRRIGLSATIGDPVATGSFLSLGTGRKTAIPKIETKGMRWRLSMEHFYVRTEQEGKNESEHRTEIISGQPKKSDAESAPAPSEADPGMGYIYKHSYNKKCLVFVNSREECEAVTSTLRQYCDYMNEPDRFLIHHGNLSAAYRETAEALMKDDEQNKTTITTATLELGIDIGRLERAFQIDAPFMVSSFLQRMGRTGRRNLPPEMWFVMREDQPEARAMLPETIPWKLLQGIALVQLYLEEKFVEPPKLSRYPYSLLYHQTMSISASCGEMRPSALASRVLSLGYFKNVSQEDYRILLRHMLDINHLQYTDEGGLIIGLRGEREIATFKFYAVFKENEEYTVRSKSQELGTIVMPPPVGEKIAIAGHVWIVEEIDHKRHLVYCEMVKGKVPAYFGQCPGDIHTKILEKIKDILEQDTTFPYLMNNAVLRLCEARNVAVNARLTRRPLINLGGEMWCLFPWLGTYAFLALERFIKIKCADRAGITAIDSSRPYFILFKMKGREEDFYRVACEMINKHQDPMDFLYNDEVPLFNKYDKYIPDFLVRKGFAYGVLNIREMKERVLSWGEFVSD